MKELQLIQATSTEGIFILTYEDRQYGEFIVELAYENLTTIIAVTYPFKKYRITNSCTWEISRCFDPVAMKKCAEEFLDAIDPEIDTKELAKELGVKE